MPATTKAKRQQQVAKPAKATKPAKAKPQPAPTKPAKPSKAKPKQEFVPPTPEEKEASDNRFYATASEHGLATENPRTGKRLSRFIIQAHALAACWPTKPLTPEQIAAACSQRFGIKITAKRVERQLIDELRTGRVKQVGNKYAKTGTTANYWSLAETEE